ncbi:MAG: DsrE/DsrF/DrsH-like family protein [Anaerolineae bacterium]|nr:DsrE/DsrF/DrsH-like family protein [Anaerolineae bacterium]
MNEHEHEARKASIVVFSGDMDKVMAAFIIATTAAASGIETTMFFTFWGLQAIKKRVSTGRTLFQKMLSLFFKDIDRIGPSKLNMGGMGRWMFKKMMKQQNVATLPELRQMAIDLGVKLLACQMSMEVMGIRREDLIDEVTDVVGAATYIAEANQSHITLFI